ncbi:hypothetical protein MAR_011737 [Mya arenaria]|uniref:Uncharacterized protein n=1 Tax=Mya arenaria TaxID=6604 RepID=A0ABY7FYQ2_MYAAR|nr:hypothetical protein MAR_011737 [Mya arenaria]
MKILKTVWCADGRPRSAPRLHRNSVNQYLIKLDQELDRKAEVNSEDFWSLVKRRRSSKKNLVGAGLNFDGTVFRDPSVITGKWAEYIQDLYTPMREE